MTKINAKEIVHDMISKDKEWYRDPEKWKNKPLRCEELHRVDEYSEYPPKKDKSKNLTYTEWKRKHRKTPDYLDPNNWRL